MQLYFTGERQETRNVGGHDAMMMERSRCWIWTGKENMVRDSIKELVTGIGNDWDSNLGDRNWDYQMKIWESIIERVVGLVPGLVYILKSTLLLTRPSPSNNRPLSGIFLKLEIFLMAFALPGTSSYASLLRWDLVLRPTPTTLQSLECTSQAGKLCWVGPCFPQGP